MRAFGLGMAFSKLFTMGLDTPRGLKVLMFSAVLSFIFLLMPGLHYLLLFSGIGIPLLPVMFFLPTLVLAWACIVMFRMILPLTGGPLKFAAYAGTALLLFLPAQWMNASGYQKQIALTADDHNSLDLPLNVQTVAVVNRMKSTTESCDRLCLHVLLSGVASTVVVKPVPVGMTVPDPDSIGMAYSFEQRASCPDVKLNPKHYWLPHGPAGQTPSSSRNAAEIATQMVASGHCLIAHEAPVSDADLIIVLGPVFQEKQRKHQLGFDFGLSGIQAARLEMYVPDASGDFEEVFRATSGTGQKFAPFLMPMPSFVLDEPSGWVKTEFRFNDKDYSEQSKWGVFDKIEDVLGLSLALDDGAYRKAAQDNIIALLEADRSPTKEEWRVFSQYWKGLNISPNGGNSTKQHPDLRDAEIARRVAASPHMKLPSNFELFVRYNSAVELVRGDVIAQGLARRLRVHNSTGKDFARAAAAMSYLPDNVLRDHLDLLQYLTTVREKRGPAARLLRKLHLGGPSAAPALANLVNAGLAEDNVKLAIQSLLGICDIGPAARPVLEGLRDTERAVRGRESKTYYQARINVSAHLGLEREKVRSLVPREILAKRAKTWFDMVYDRAAASNSPCHI